LCRISSGLLGSKVDCMSRLRDVTWNALSSLMVVAAQLGAVWRFAQRWSERDHDESRSVSAHALPRIQSNAALFTRRHQGPSSQVCQYKPLQWSGATVGQYVQRIRWTRWPLT